MKSQFNFNKIPHEVIKPLIQVWLFMLILGITNLAQAACVTADVVAIDQAFYYNRLGAMNPSGMMYALKSDVVARDGAIQPSFGNVMLRPDKRTRPLVLRVNEGDCLTVQRRF